jgi:Tfp pilus assembly protein FimV
MTKRILAGPLVAGTLGLLAATALAQQAAPTAPTPSTPAPAAAPSAAAPAGQAAPVAALPPGSPLIGRPANSEAAAKLAPVPAPPLAATTNKIPLDKLKAPKGFNLELYASGMPNARSLALSDKGTVFVGSRLQDKVYAITPTRTANTRSMFWSPGSIVRMASPSKTARSTSPNCRKFRRSNTSTTSSTPRPSPPSSIATYRRTKRTAGNFWRSVPTTSSISRSASRARQGSRPASPHQSRRQRRRSDRVWHPWGAMRPAISDIGVRSGSVPCGEVTVS